MNRENENNEFERERIVRTLFSKKLKGGKE